MSSAAHFIEFSRPFIEAGKNVFKTMIFTELKAEKPVVKKDNKSQGDISAVLGLSGNVMKDGTEVPYRAMLIISFPYETYFKVSSAMLMEDFTEMSDEIRDVGGEICNMIMGNAKRDLKTMGYTSNMAIPSIVEGKDHTISYPQGTTVVQIPMTTDHGKLFIELCYADGA